MSRQQVYDKVGILGVDVDGIGLTEAIAYICDYAADHTKPAGYVIKPYVEFLDRAAADPKLAGLLNHAELAIADGVAVLWAAHYLYAGPRTPLRFWVTLCQIVLAPAKLSWPVPERAAGTNFTWPLLQAAAETHLRVFLIGKETPEEIEAVAATITKQIPGLQVVGTLSGRDPDAPRGRVSEAWTQATATRLRDAGADLTLVGMGFPLQEGVCAELAAGLPHGLLIGEGGTFDYASFGGARQKAPAWLQRVGLEWLWRLLLEPSRLRRALAIPRFIFRVWRSR